MSYRVDHIVVGADTLQAGACHLQQSAGVELTKGSKHVMMSTHNLVAQCAPGAFLEIIAIDPDAPVPGRTRWFTLDDADTQKRLLKRAQALCWVVNTDNLDAVVESSPVDLGEIVLFTRGDRSWRLTVPQDGSLPENGLLPAFIEWSPGPHPSEAMDSLGLTLTTVSITHPEPENISVLLAELKVDHLTTVSKGERALAFVLDTPKGRLNLS